MERMAGEKKSPTSDQTRSETWLKFGRKAIRKPESTKSEWLETLRGGFLLLIRWSIHYPLVFGTYRLQNWLRAPFGMEQGGEKDKSHSHSPGILVSNYGNYFFDNLIGLMVAPVWPFYFVRECVYRIPVMNWIHQFFRAIPVVRNGDAGYSPRERDAVNNPVYDDVVGLLKKGHWLSIFPESRPGHRSQVLEPLRPGAAVIALRAESESGWTLGLKIYVYGTNYENKFIGRSNVYLQWADPIIVAKYRSLYMENPRFAEMVLMSEVEEALHKVVLEARDVEMLENAHRVAFQQKRASFGGVRSVIDDIEKGRISKERLRINLSVTYESMIYQMAGYTLFLFGWLLGLPFRWFGRLCGRQPSEDMSYQLLLWLMVLFTGFYMGGWNWFLVQIALTWSAMEIWLWAWRRNVVKSAF